MNNNKVTKKLNKDEDLLLSPGQKLGADAPCPKLSLALHAWSAGVVKDVDYPPTSQTLHRPQPFSSHLKILRITFEGKAMKNSQENCNIFKTLQQ